MSLDEAKTAVLNAARKLQQAYPLPNAAIDPTLAYWLRPLYGAVEAVEAVGAQAEVASTGLSTLGRGPCEVCFNIAWAPSPDGEYCGHCSLRDAYARLCEQLADLRGDRPGLCAHVECWRVADVGSTCHHHSAFAGLPSARIAMRDPLFERGRDG